MLGSDRPIFKVCAPAASPKKETKAVAEPSQEVRQFIARVGGVENARRALEMLGILSKAA